MEQYDFSGWATKNDLPCADGRTIKKNAFKECDGTKVPLVWNHQHNDPDNVLGHALLKNREDGVYAYCTFNDTDSGKAAKKLVKHGDVKSLSIYANKLKQVGGDVLHGVIRELSLVLAGANPGATIDFVMAHGEDGEELSGMIANYDEAGLVYIMHGEDTKNSNKEGDNSNMNTKDNKGSEPTVQDVIDSMNEDQKKVLEIMVGMALDDASSNTQNDKGDKEMKHNVFDMDRNEGGFLTHADQSEIINLAKSNQVGSFQAALEIYSQENDIQHDAISSGFSQQGEGGVTALFPDYKDLKPGAPELITDDQSWVSGVLAKVHKSPISRIRTGQVDIRNADQLRAKGYQKGKQKGITGNFNLARRTTDPQTIYVKNALHRDDIIDITDFDYVQYLYNIDRMMLNEELATAILFGDGREEGDPDKIAEDKIRPIWTDDELYTRHYDLDFAQAKAELQGTGTATHFGENYIKAEAMINACLYSREQYKGSGKPDMYIEPHMLNVMLLARDMNGRRIYSSVSELATSFNVGAIHTVEQMVGKKRVVNGQEKKLVALIVNLADYQVGATKGGEVTHFTQFDIDFNQQKSLLETRCSGALTKIYSAIAIEEPVAAEDTQVEG